MKAFIQKTIRFTLDFWSQIEKIMAERNQNASETIIYLIKLGMIAHKDDGIKSPYQVERVEDIKPYVYDGPVIPAKLEEDSGTPPPNFNNTTTADPPNFDNTTTGEAPKNNLRLFGDEEDGIKF